MSDNHDYILAGGGLQACLLAMAIYHHRPDARVLILERNSQLCGNHTWSFHESDITGVAKPWVESLPVTTWPAYEVQFPKFRRTVDLAYCSLQSHDLERHITGLADRHALEIRTNCPLADVTVDRVRTNDGTEFLGGIVVDCRGMSSPDASVRCGYQKFHGFEIELGSGNWPDRLPILMDATGPQQDGFQFMYVLPLTTKRVLIEETRFSENRQLDRDDCHRNLKAFLAKRSIGEFHIVREESGCLPMPFNGALKPQASIGLRGGYAGGWFHAATGYSFPLAVRFADLIASSDQEQLVNDVMRLASENRFQATFSRFLNRMLFRLVSPERRWEIFRRFYSVLPDETIQRFYAHQFTRWDAVRILIGSPPSGLTPRRFFRSFKGTACPAIQT